MDTIHSSPSTNDNANGLRRLLNTNVWIPLLVAVVAGMLVHSTIYVNGLVTPDGLWYGEYSLAGSWEISIGRWGLYLVDLLHGGINSNTMIAFFAILYTALAGVLLNSLFQVKCTAKAIIIPTVLTCSPMLSMFITYPFCADAYALSILLGVFSVYAISAFSGTVKKIVISALCVMLLTSVYQSSLGVTLAVAAGYLIMRLLRDAGELKAAAKDILHVIIAVVVGVILYYAVTQLILIIWDASLADYKGASSVSISHILQNIPGGIRNAYKFFWAFFLNDWMVKNVFFTKYVYIILAVIALVSMIIRFVSGGRKHPYLPVICLVLLVLLPVCCNVICLIVPETDIYLLMAAGMMMTIPLLIAMTDINRDGESEKKVPAWLQKGLRVGGAAVAAVLVWAFILTCQTDAIVMRSAKNQTTMLANRIWQHVETREDYIQGETRLLVAGRPMDGNYPNPSRLLYEANPYATWGLVWETYNGNLHTWEQVFRQYIGTTYRNCTVEEYAAIAATEAFDRMTLYPDAGSIQMIDDVLVVKISDVSGWSN